MDQFTSPQIGLALRRLRKKHNLTQKDLANGICSQAEISKIESGTHSPTVDLLYALSVRLQVPLTTFLNQSNTLETIKIIDDELLTKFQNKKYEEIFRLSKKNIEHLDKSEELRSLYSFYLHLSAFRLRKIDYRTCIIQLQRLSDNYIKIYYSPKMLFRIKSSIATIYQENSNFLYSLKTYEELLSFSFDSEELLVEKIRLLYNISKILVSLAKYERALNYVKEGIYLSLRFKDMSLLGQLFYQKGYILEMSGSTLYDINDAYQKAYTLFDILGMEEYKQILIQNNKVTMPYHSKE
ncbi:helix-turn-helix domain-containing protein [Exiguobacterium antarcticum]|uniref:helix-turn-helix domain-containing protein n=1 Tax=Exiguobacterium antarcticum TaxID=132920 RepID=UPI00047DF1F2|nr:helix-turn-helix domain-containing protein [Exiguobacterium antarcticum]